MKTITVESGIHAPVERVWEMWTEPTHIVQWAFASDDWEAPHAENDVRVGGAFKTTMAAKDKSERFDVTGTYTTVVPYERLEYTIEDGRKVTVQFQSMGGTTQVVETFEPYPNYTEEQEHSGWQAILDNFKKYAEGTK